MWFFYVWATEASLGRPPFSTIMKKWKWLFINGCRCYGIISFVTDFVLRCAETGQMKQYAGGGGVASINDNLVE